MNENKLIQFFRLCLNLPEKTAIISEGIEFSFK